MCTSPEIVSSSPDIVCKMTIVSLHDEPVYSALSYMWGDAKERTYIIVDGRRTSVTKNLAHALGSVNFQWKKGPLANEPDERKMLWADAICINQADTLEKNHQVSMMGDVYHSAERVFSWLGLQNVLRIHASFDTNELIWREIKDLPQGSKNSVEWMKSLPVADPDMTDEEMVESRVLLRKNLLFYNIPYWTRVWILQELVLARDVIFLCETRALPLHVVEEVQQWTTLVQKSHTIDGKPDGINATDWIFVMTAKEPELLRIYRGRRFSPRCRTGGKKPPTFPSSSAIMSFAHCFQATNPKDYVYGFAGISGLDAHADYAAQKTVADVYRDYIVQWLDMRPGPFWDCEDVDGIKYLEDSLWFLRHAGIGYNWNSIEGLPSWAPNFVGAHEDKSYHDDAPGGFYGKSGRGVFASCKEPVVVRGSILYCPGIKVDRMVSKGPLVTGDGEEEGYMEMLVWISQYITAPVVHPHTNRYKLLDVLQALLRTVWHNNQPSPEKFLPLTMLLYVSYLIESKEDLTEKDAHSFGIGGAAKTTFKSYCEQIELKRICKSALDIDPSSMDSPMVFFTDMHRNFLFQLQPIHGFRLGLTSDGYIGVFPPRMQEDDIVCVLKHSSVPVLLRQVADHYEHVGTCFVPGLMNGEAARNLFQGRTSIETLEIR
jgi:hypothetical protein